MRARLLVFLLLLPVAGCHRKTAALPAPPAPVPQAAPRVPSEEPNRRPKSSTLPVTPTAPAQPTQPAAESPIRLGRALGADEQRALNANIDEHLANAQRVLLSLAGKRLNRQQTDSAEHVKSFIAQAVETRKTDLAAARSLAERADVLASDLARSVK